MKKLKSSDDNKETPTRSTKTSNNIGLTPLKCAVREGAPSPVLNLLLGRTNINMDGFDDYTIHLLYQIVRDKADLQDCINQRLSDRIPCFISLMQLYLRIYIFIVMLMSIDFILENSELPEIVIFPISMIIYLFFEIPLELQELSAVGGEYFTRLKNYFDFLRIG